MAITIYVYRNLWRMYMAITIFVYRNVVETGAQACIYLCTQGALYADTFFPPLFLYTDTCSILGTCPRVGPIFFYAARVCSQGNDRLPRRRSGAYL